MPATIVVGVNGDPGTSDALALARTLQYVIGGELVAAAVDTRGHRNAAGHGRPPAGAEDLRTVAVSAASVAKGLRQAAADEDAVLLVAGASHRTGLARRSRQAGGERLLTEPGCALAFAPPGYADQTDHDVRVIAVGFDGGSAAAEAAQAAGALARRVSGTVRVFSFTEPTLTPTVSATVGAGTAATVTGSSLRRRLDAAVEELLEDLPAEVRASGRVELGEPVHGLVEQAGAVDLLVLGSHGRGVLDRAVFGSVAEQVVHAAPVPVLVFPPGSAAAVIAAAAAAG